MPAGRPSKLTSEIRQKALALARLGRFKTYVAAKLHVHYVTLNRWLAGDEEFALEYAAAEAVGEENLLETALKGGEEGKAAQWYLERWRQFRYGRRQRHEVTGKGGGAIQHNVSADDALFDRLTRLAAGAEGSDGGGDRGGA